MRLIVTAAGGAVVPEHQLSYLQAVCTSAQRAAQRARADAAAAEMALADGIDTGMKPSQLQAIWKLQREAVEKLHIGLFFTRLYVCAIQARP
jgi:hypothetical protein